MRASRFSLLLVVAVTVMAAFNPQTRTLACPRPGSNPNEVYNPKEGVKVFNIEDKNNISVGKEEEFAIRLHSNPTTGYTWMLVNDTVPAGLELLGCNYQREPRAGAAGELLVGVGGADTWGFRATGSGKVELRLQYARPWIRNQADTTVFTINIK